MNINQRVRQSKKHSVDLPVEADGVLLTIRAKDFVVGGNQYALAEDEEYEVGDSDSEVCLVGFLVLTKEGEARLFVDERSIINPAFSFETQDDLKLLKRLFILDVPAHTTSLADLELILYKFVQAEEAETTDA